jgi:hypothetical protein
MKLYYRHKKTKEVLEVIRCDYCGESMKKIDFKNYERICAVSGDSRIKTICLKCTEKRTGNDVINVCL